jgi:hypothetical protein
LKRWGRRRRRSVLLLLLKLVLVLEVVLKVLEVLLFLLLLLLLGLLGLLGLLLLLLLRWLSPSPLNASLELRVVSQEPCRSLFLPHCILRRQLRLNSIRGWRGGWGWDGLVVVSPSTSTTTGDSRRGSAGKGRGSELIG